MPITNTALLYSVSIVSVLMATQSNTMEYLSDKEIASSIKDARIEACEEHNQHIVDEFTDQSVALLLQPKILEHIQYYLQKEFDDPKIYQSQKDSPFVENHKQFYITFMHKISDIAFFKKPPELYQVAQQINLKAHQLSPESYAQAFFNFFTDYEFLKDLFGPDKENQF